MTSSIKTTIGNLLCILPLAVLAVPSALADANTAGWYVEKYGSAVNTDQTDRAQEIFRKIVQASGTTFITSRLVIIDSLTTPWAIALPDNNILLSKGALDILYQEAETELADARLAFVLGHELSHQINRDFWHQNILYRLSGPGVQALKTDMTTLAADRTTARQREIVADESGFILASLAGYRADLILPHDNNTSSFFTYWVDQTETGGSDTHPDSATRTAFLQERLRLIQDKIDYFQYGVRLAHFGRYEDALGFLGEFYKEYPSRQVLNNMGYVYLQLARKKMPESLSSRFWLPGLIETDSGFGKPSRSYLPTLTKAAIDDLQQAVKFLLSASEIDPSNLTSLLNLTAAYFYLGEFHKARAAIEDARTLEPNNPAVLSFRALILFEQSPEIDMWSIALDIHESIESSGSAPNSVIYNLAKLLEERGRSGKARHYWKILADGLHQLPSIYQRAVCHKLTERKACNDKSQAYSIRKYDWGFPVRHGDDIDSAESREALNPWRQSEERKLGATRARILTNADNNSMLALNYKIEFATVVGHGYASTDELLEEHGNPRLQYAVADGEIWSYGASWSAWIKDGTVREIWVSEP